MHRKTRYTRPQLSYTRSAHTQQQGRIMSDNIWNPASLMHTLRSTVNRRGNKYEVIYGLYYYCNGLFRIKKNPKISGIHYKR